MKLRNESILERLKEYPSCGNEILETWSMQASLWDKLNKDGGGRLNKCHERVTTTPIDVNPFGYVDYNVFE
jgi:hypothetical protein